MLHDVEKSRWQKLAEAEVGAFRDALGPFVTAAETTRMPMMFTSAVPADHPIVFVNQAFLEMTGFEEHELLGQSFDALMDAGTDPEMLVEIQTAFEGGRGLEPTVRYRRKDDSTIWVAIYIASVCDADGNIVQYFASFVDLTSSRNEVDRLRGEVHDLNDRLDKLVGKPHTDR